MIKAGKLYISLWTLVLVFVSAFCGALKWLAYAYGVLLLHELAHYFAAKRLHIACKGFAILPFGMSIRLCDNRIEEPVKEILLCAAGPAINLCAAAFLYASFRTASPDVYYLTVSNAAIALINLLPILPLDGGRILKAYLTERLGMLQAIRITEHITCFFVLAVGLCALAALWTMCFHVSVMILIAFLFFNMSQEKRNNEYLMMRQLAEYKNKLTKRKLLSVKTIAVQADALAKTVAQHFSYDKFYMICVFDEEQRLTRCLSETQVIDGLIGQGRQIKIGSIR